MSSPGLRPAGVGAPLRPLRAVFLPLVLALSALVLALSACEHEPLEPGTNPPDPDSIPREALGVIWEEVPGNPRMPLPDCPTWNCLGNTDPWVGRGPGGQRMAWYSAGGSLGGPVVGRALVTEDLRFIPDPANAPVLALQEGVWDKHRETVSLRWDEPSQRWTLWYLGYETSFLEDPALGQMTTTDPRGITWERPAAPIYRAEPDGWDFAFLSGPRNPVLGPGAPGSWNDLRVVSPHVTREADGSLLLFAHGQARSGIGRSLGEIGVWRSRVR